MFFFSKELEHKLQKKFSVDRLHNRSERAEFAELLQLKNMHRVENCQQKEVIIYELILFLVLQMFFMHHSLQFHTMWLRNKVLS